MITTSLTTVGGSVMLTAGEAVSALDNACHTSVTLTSARHGTLSSYD
ncbi:hypothetical protein [Vreelandella zhaodongensis]